MDKVVITVNTDISADELKMAKQINELLKQNANIRPTKTLLLVLNQQFSTGNVLVASNCSQL